MKIQKHITVLEEQDIKIKELTLLSKKEYLDAKESVPPTKGWWWWLRSPGRDQHYAAYVINFGSLYYYNVIDVSGCVRPALRISNLESSNLQIGDKFDLVGCVWTVISEGIALCDNSGGKTCFREDWEAGDANNYDASDIKKWLANWAEEHGIEVEP